MDLRHVHWVSPIGVAGLLALSVRAARDGVSTLSFVAPETPHVRSYLNSIGFVDEIVARGGLVDREPGDVPPIRPSLRATFVTTEFEMEAAAAKLELALMEMAAPAVVLHSCYLVMTEVTNNAWQHGSPCYVVAQTHSGKTSGTPGLHLAVADFGPGFMATLAAFAPANEQAAIELAFQEGVTRTGDPVRGLGLAHAIESMDDFPGSRLEVVSHDGSVVREHGQTQPRSRRLRRGLRFGLLSVRPPSVSV